MNKKNHNTYINAIGAVSLMDALPCSVLLIDADYRIEYANSATLKTYGKKGKKILGERCTHVIHGCDDPVEDCPLKDVIKKGTFIEKEVYDSKKKNWLLSCIYPIKNTEKNKKNLYLHFITDITEKKNLEKAQSLLKNIMEQAADMIFIIDPDTGIILDTNLRVESLLGYSKKALKKMKITELEVFKKGMTWQDYIKKIRTKKMHVYESVFKNKGGSILPIEVNIKVVSLNNEDYVVAISRDISERKEAEKYIKEQQSALKSKNIALKEVLEQVTVEKKELTDNIVSNLEKLIMPKLRLLNSRSPSDNRKQIELIKNNIENIASDFGRKINKKEISLSPREIEVSDMIKNGLKSKEIAKELKLSIKTIETIRKNIRKKLKISNKKTNLNSLLKSL